MPYAPYNEYADTSVYLGNLKLPHVTVISPTAEWEQTELPIEGGAVITDHRRKRPRELSITGMITGQVEIVPSAGGQLLDTSTVRHQIEFSAEIGQLFDVRWKDRTWTNMSIISIDEEFTAADQRDDQWLFTLNMKETRIASSTTGLDPSIAESLADLTAVPLDGGAQSGTTVGPDVAASLAGAVGGGV